MKQHQMQQSIDQPNKSLPPFEKPANEPYTGDAGSMLMFTDFSES